MTDSRFLPVPDAVVGSRADAGLARMTGLSRSRAAEIIEDGGVVQGGRILDKSDRLADGILMVEFPSEEPRDEPSVPGGIAVLYEDEHVAVIDKPVGVAAHGSPGWTGPTVVGALAAQCVTLASSGAAEREGIVHRLDVGTSGLMVVAKSDLAYSVLKRAFKERTVEKVYHALAQGHLDPTSGTIDAPIGRHPSSDYKFAVVSDGRPSVTHYETLEMFPHGSLLEIHLETGRTHQIRVHMAAMRHPLAGDLTYGADPALAKRLGLTRQWLHARELAFAHPATGDEVRVVSEYPADLAAALEIARG